MVAILKKEKLYRDSERLCFLSFNHCFDYLVQFSEMLHLPHPDPKEKGTVYQYEQYWVYKCRYEISPENKNTWFEPNTLPGIRAALDAARIKGRRVRLWMGDTYTGEDWMEYEDVVGYIGRTYGPMKMPTLLKSRLSKKGLILSTIDLVRIMDVKSRKDLYKHPKFHTLGFVSGKDDYKAAPFTLLDRQGNIVTRFPAPKARECWLEFIRGERFTLNG